MTTPRALRLEFHTDGRSVLLETTADPTLARDILARHTASLKANASVGRLVLLDESSGQVLARKTLTARSRRSSSSALAR
jgi:hypothetical protein